MARKPEIIRKIPKIVETLKQAYLFREALSQADISSKAVLARKFNLTRARVTQLTNLLRLAPEIQEAILALEQSPSGVRLSERTLRPLVSLPMQVQIVEFQKLLP